MQIVRTVLFVSNILAVREKYVQNYNDYSSLPGNERKAGLFLQFFLLITVHVLNVLNAELFCYVC